MSTRATYCFIPNDKWDPKTTLYIHHDGYESGAAEKARRVADFNGMSNGGIAEKWLRALPGEAEITREHKAHADTEYQYDFTDNGTQVKVRHVGRGILYEGNTADWINKQLDLNQPGEDRCVTFRHEVLTVNRVLAIVKDALEYAKHTKDDWHMTMIKDHVKGIPEAEALLT